MRGAPGVFENNSWLDTPLPRTYEMRLAWLSLIVLIAPCQLLWFFFTPLLGSQCEEPRDMMGRKVSEDHRGFALLSLIG